MLNPAIVKGYWTKEVSNPDQCDDYLYLIRSFKLLHVNSTFAILDIDCQFYILTGRSEDVRIGGNAWHEAMGCGRSLSTWQNRQAV